MPIFILGLIRITDGIVPTVGLYVEHAVSYWTALALKMAGTVVLSSYMSQLTERSISLIDSAADDRERRDESARPTIF